MDERKRSFVIIVITLVMILLLSLILFSPLRTTLFGKAITQGGFTIDVQCPAQVSINQEFTCTLSVIEETEGIFGAQFIINSEDGLAESGNGAGNIDFQPQAPIVGISAGIEGQTILYSETEILLAENTELAQFNIRSQDTPGSYTISLTDLKLAGLSDEAVIEVIAPEPTPEPETTPTPQPASSSGGGGGGGSSRRQDRSTCEPVWECSDWSYCNNKLQQTGTCVDVSDCAVKAAPKQETRSCAQCDVKWLCSGWSECVNGKQTRTCTDEHLCGTERLKPEEEKACFIPQPVPEPKPLPPPPVVEEPSPGFWDRYLWWVLAAIMVSTSLLGLYAWKRLHVKESQYEKTAEWIRDEWNAGVTTQEITSLLEENQWQKPDIVKALWLADNPVPGKRATLPRTISWITQGRSAAYTDEELTRELLYKDWNKKAAQKIFSTIDFPAPGITASEKNILQWISNRESAGFSGNELKKELLINGWEEEVIQNILKK